MNWRNLNPSRNSIWRLTLTASALLAGMLLLFSLLLYQLLLGEQQRQVLRQLEGQAAQIQALAKQTEANQWPRQLASLQSGQMLLAWRQQQHWQGALSFVPEQPPLLPQTSTIAALDPLQRQLRLLTASATETRHGTVLLATPSDSLGQLIQSLQRLTAILLPLLLLLSLAGGYLLARRHLMRLTQFNQCISAIEQGQLQQRLPSRDDGDEFDQLANSVNAMTSSLANHIATVQGISDNLAHDLRTPLTRLRLQLERKLSQDPSLGEAIEQLDNVLITFDALLSLTKLEQGQQSINWQPVELNELLQQLQELLSYSAEDHQQQLQIIPTKVQLQADPQLLFQALFNLIDNAIKYAGAGATISVSAEPLQQTLVITVADNGPGVKPEQLDRLTQRSYRADNSRSQQGFGLGLTLVQAIAKRHGGNIQIADNQPGLQVKLLLPVASAAIISAPN